MRYSRRWLSPRPRRLRRQSRPQVAFRNFTISRSYTADSGGTAQTLFPAGGLFDGIIGYRWNQNGTGATFVGTAKVLWNQSGLTVTNQQQLSGLSAVAGMTLTQSGGNIRGASATGAATYAGTIVVSFNGEYIS